MHTNLNIINCPNPDSLTLTHMQCRPIGDFGVTVGFGTFQIGGRYTPTRRRATGMGIAN